MHFFVFLKTYWHKKPDCSMQPGFALPWSLSWPLAPYSNNILSKGWW